MLKGIKSVMLVVSFLKRYLIVVAVVLFVAYSVHPGRFASLSYPCIRASDIENSLVTAPPLRGLYGENIRQLCPIMPRDLCNETSLIKQNFLQQDVNWQEHLKSGGTWQPSFCIPRHRVAIIIPFRNRTHQLQIFLNYMHPFLQKQLLDYQVFVVEQLPGLSFNRAKLFNIGFKEALKLYPFHCFIFHDVDLIPQKANNMYACTREPRHMSSSLDSFRYNLPYEGLFGGAIAILKQQFEEVNGFSNVFYGWGGEDDDFYNRVYNHNRQVFRYCSSVARYTMLSHLKESPSQDRYVQLETGKKRFDIDGLNSLKYSIQRVDNFTLYTRIIVDVL